MPTDDAPPGSPPQRNNPLHGVTLEVIVTELVATYGWADLGTRVRIRCFTDDPSVRAASRQYLSTVAPMYAFLGLSTTCYFSSQGAAKVIGPVLAQTARLLFIGAGGWWLSTHDATAQSFFMLAAASMVLLGVLSCISVMLTRWGPKQPVPVVKPALS